MKQQKHRLSLDLNKKGGISGATEKKKHNKRKGAIPQCKNSTCHFLPLDAFDSPIIF